MRIRPARRHAAALSVALVGALALAGCGGGGTTGTATSGAASGDPTQSTTSEAPRKDASAGELLKGMQTAANAATSVKISGNMTQGGQPMTVEIAGNRDGSNSTAKVSMGVDQGTATLITVDGKTYIQGDKLFWDKNAGPGLYEQFSGKYIEMPSESASQMGDISVGSILDAMFKDQKFTAVDGWTTGVERGDLDGQEVYILTDKADANTKVYVSADGKDNLMKIEGTLDDSSGTPGSVDMTFSDWNAVAPVTAPPADQVMQIPGM